MKWKKKNILLKMTAISIIVFLLVTQTQTEIFKTGRRTNAPTPVLSATTGNGTVIQANSLNDLFAALPDNAGDVTITVSGDTQSSPGWLAVPTNKGVTSLIVKKSASYPGRPVLGEEALITNGIPLIWNDCKISNIVAGSFYTGIPVAKAEVTVYSGEVNYLQWGDVNKNLNLNVYINTFLTGKIYPAGSAPNVKIFLNTPSIGYIQTMQSNVTLYLGKPLKVNSINDVQGVKIACWQEKWTGGSFKDGDRVVEYTGSTAILANTFQKGWSGPAVLDSEQLNGNGRAWTYKGVSAQEPTVTFDDTQSSIQYGTPGKLEVKASVTDGGTLSYQWYAKDKNGIKTKLGGNSSSLNYSSLYPGTYSYFCEVTNTLNDGTTASFTTSEKSVTLKQMEITLKIPNDMSGFSTSNWLNYITASSDSGNVTLQNSDCSIQLKRDGNMATSIDRPGTYEITVSLKNKYYSLKGGSNASVFHVIIASSGGNNSSSGGSGNNGSSGGQWNGNGNIQGGSGGGNSGGSGGNGNGEGSPEDDSKDEEGEGDKDKDKEENKLPIIQVESLETGSATGTYLLDGEEKNLTVQLVTGEAVANQVLQVLNNMNADTKEEIYVVPFRPEFTKEEGNESEPGGSIKVSVPIPGGMVGSKENVRPMHITSDGKAEYMEGTLEQRDGCWYMTFQVNDGETYALEVRKQPAEPTPKPSATPKPTAKPSATPKPTVKPVEKPGTDKGKKAGTETKKSTKNKLVTKAASQKIIPAKATYKGTKGQLDRTPKTGENTLSRQIFVFGILSFCMVLIFRKKAKETKQ